MKWRPGSFDSDGEPVPEWVLSFAGQRGGPDGRPYPREIEHWREMAKFDRHEAVAGSIGTWRAGRVPGTGIVKQRKHGAATVASATA